MVGSWQTREGHGEDAMKSPLQMLPFRGVFATRVLRVYYVHGDVTTLVSLRSRPHSVLTAFQVRSPNLAQNKRHDSAIINNYGDHSTMSGVSGKYIKLIWRPWRALGPFSVAVAAQ